MKIGNVFSSGKMNKDIDERLIPKGEYVHALNASLFNTIGVVENHPSNVQSTSISLGSNAKAIGVVEDDALNKIYWAAVSDIGSYVCEYDATTQQASFVLQDTRVGSNNVLGFSSDQSVDMTIINDSENGKVFLVLVNGVNEPKYFEVSEAKLLPASTFLLEDVSLIKSPPIDSPQITLSDTGTEENYIEDKFYSFAYRYIYSNNEASALSPFSDFAFFPETFKYDYDAGENKSMKNVYNKITVSVNTGSSRVKEIEVIAKKSGESTYYIVEKIDKADQGLSDNATKTFDFKENKIYRALSVEQTTRVYDNVPTSAYSVETIGNRLVFGNYTEGYDMVNGSDKIVPDLDLTLSSTSGVSGTAHTSVKSNVDYQIGISYLDGKGRMTTPFTSDDATVHVPYTNSNKKNKLGVFINNKAPEWATSYRLFIKQSKGQYDVLSPVRFYLDGVYAWIKIEGDDINKVKTGDFLIVKSDTSGIRRSEVKIKVLEASSKSRNFLEDSSEVSTIQEAGNYIKISTENIALNISAVDSYKYDGYGFRSDATYNNYVSNQTYIEPKVFYGTGTDNLSFSGTYTGTTDKRFEIEIMGIDPFTLVDRIKFRELDCKENTYSAWNDNFGTGYSAGSSTSIGDGITVTFSSGFGHTIGDKWIISAKAEQRGIEWYGSSSEPVESDGRRAIMSFKLKDNTDQTIRAGAIINIEIDDTHSESIDNASGYLFQSFVSSADYANMEEWFWGDNIITKMEYPETTADVMFRRGTLSANREQLTINPSGTLHMCMLTKSNYIGGGKVRVDFSVKIVELDNKIIFETDPDVTSSEVFYELPETYGIVNGNHQGDVNQVFGVTAAYISLDYFNCFGWYNGFESIKIADGFNRPVMINNNKPLIPVDNYRRVVRFSSMTYGDVYESSTSYNGLNAFNLALVNYKDLDPKFGAISKMISDEGDIFIFQSNRVSRVLYRKNVLYNTDNTGNVAASADVLGQEIPYAGEYGISSGPYSAVAWGSRIYFSDVKRNAVCRLSADGITEVSDYGMKNWFRDNMRIGTSPIMSYDPFNGQVITSIYGSYSLSFNEQTNGWVSFLSYLPELMVNLNNDFYSIKSGQLYIHNQYSVDRNTFYGVQYNTEINTVINDSPSEVKIFKTIEIQGVDGQWDVEIDTVLDAGHINKESFSDKEGFDYAYIRRNVSDEPNFNLTSVKGIGVVSSFIEGEYTFASINGSIGIGDTLYTKNNSVVAEVGTITNISGNTIYVASEVDAPISGAFMFAAKSQIAESYGLKGYHAKVNLVSSQVTPVELYGITSEVVKSFP